MKILSWNCQGLGSPWTVRNLVELVKLHNPGLVFLSETKSKGRRHDRVKERLNYYGVGVESQGKSGGLLMLWRKDVDVWIQTYSPHHMDALVKADKDTERWRITGIYGHPEDMGFSGYPYTWCNSRVAPNTVRERLDRAVCCSKWSQLFPKAQVHHDIQSSSDHSAVWVDLDPCVISKKQGKRRRFRFEAIWTKSESCKEVIQQCWSGVYQHGNQQDFRDKLRE
ncbi:UNVERIFIED_CONTAM: hypothetical protein Sradi_1604600 [Sesamum radiatum]|uniref:Endonuclease/exonuclease/phosphatase domain-containing protein n=1 Tax=Sesamum radiatum TaxID=300843 RepID=A0AAW2UAV6_SESRA